MDGAAALGVLLLALIFVAGFASFAVASLIGGAVASIVVRRRSESPAAAWSLVAVAGIVVGPVVLVGLIVLGSALDPATGGVPLLYPTWIVTALAGAATRVALLPALRL